MVLRVFFLVGAMMLAAHSEIVMHQSNFWSDNGIWFSSALAEDVITTAAAIVLTWLALRKSGAAAKETAQHD